MSVNVEKIRKLLASAGFNLFSVLNSGLIDGQALPAGCQSILLIGNAGDDLWQQMPDNYLQRDNPVDDYSRETISNVLLQELPAAHFSFLFPGDDPAAVPSLQKLGEIAGWHNPSPLGLGINQRHGVWFGYRAVVAVSAALAGDVFARQPSPCLTCSDTPCVSACPASALAPDRHPDLVSCVQFRMQHASPCAQTCLARLSCPVATRWRYSDAQLSYYYQHSLAALIKWVSQESQL